MSLATSPLLDPNQQSKHYQNGTRGINLIVIAKLSLATLTPFRLVAATYYRPPVTLSQCHRKAHDKAFRHTALPPTWALNQAIIPLA